MTNTLKVLNIEDSEDDALLVQRELDRSGFHVVWERVETAEDFSAALDRQTWDVIISDYHLPKFNASTALQIVQQRNIDLPFIVVSGTIGETSAVELMKAGAHDYLIKGNLTRLPEAVRREVRDAEIRAERQRSQLELNLIKERLQLAVEGSGIGLWDWSIQTGDVIINQQSAEILGYNLDELAHLNIKTWWQFNHPEDLPKAKFVMEQHVQQKTPVYECELRKRHKSGTWVWVLSRGKVVEWDMDGKPQRMTGTNLDISDRKQAELRVEMQNSILERIAKGEPLSNILDALVLAIENQIEGGRCSILLCDREAKLHHGAAPNLPDSYNQALKGIAIGEGVGSCGTSAFRKEPVIVSDIATDPLWQDYKEIVLSYGFRSCWSFPAIASDGSVLATFAIYHSDIHSPEQQELEVIALAANIVKIAIEREQATQALEQLNRELEVRIQERTQDLQRSEENVRATLLALPDIVFRANREGKYVDFMASPQGENLVDPQQVIGKSLDEVLPMDIDSSCAKTKYSVLQQAIATQTVQNYEQQVRIAGKLRYEEVRVAPCGDDEVVFFIRDISDRKQAELQLQHTNQELARATRLKDEFLANMSHELRTPLNAILGMTEGLQEQVFGLITDRQLKALQTIEFSGNHLLELINDILDISKIASGQIELDCTPTSVNHLCQSSLAFIKQQAMQKRIQIRTECPPNLPDLLVDERRIRQVLINLLNNAVKFTPEGGHITLEVSSQIQRRDNTSHLAEENTSINSQTQTDVNINNFLRISVIDTGIGIAPEYINKLFQPFIQIDSALNRQYQGTGLGLALVKQIVEIHGGKVALTSEVGVGSCFTIELPCAEDAPSSAFMTRQIALGLESSQGTQKISPLILFVEDNEANIMTVSSYLTAKGYRIVLANNGQEAIALAESTKPDLILIDVQISEMNGLEVIQKIRQIPHLVKVPMIALTTLAMEPDRDYCLAVGANDYLNKPVKLKQLTKSIQQLLASNS